MSCLLITRSVYLIEDFWFYSYSNTNNFLLSTTLRIIVRLVVSVVPADNVSQPRYPISYLLRSGSVQDRALLSSFPPVSELSSTVRKPHSVTLDKNQ
jgi:hypothetical protein